MNEAVVESKPQKRKGSISEEDISTLLQRYTATTVLCLLREVAQFQGVKVDWNELVKKTSTGITNAREYQTLWRHLAYRGSLPEKLEDGDEPLDNDSDLEYELEAFPAVSTEASTEAAACVKVLIGSGITSDSSLQNNSTVEAPLTINIPNGQSSRASGSSQPPCHTQGMNITVPVSVQKQPLPAVASTEGMDGNGLASGNNASRKRRKPWSEAEDLELIAAVQKCGEGNWANILKADFKGNRTASQLSQRWAIIRKRHGNMHVGIAHSMGPQLSEAQLAARHAMSLALDMPVKNIRTAGTTANGTFGNSTQSAATAESPFPGNIAGLAHHQPQQISQQRSSPVQSVSIAPKSRVLPKKASPKADMSPDSMGIKAAAVAAGARIATPSDAASLLKAAQAKNAVHIIPSGSLIKPSPIPGGSTTHSRPHPGVNFRSTGVAVTSSHAGSATEKESTSATASIPSALAKAPTISLQKSNISSVVATELPLTREAKDEEKMVDVVPKNMTKEPNKEDGTCALDDAARQVTEDYKVLVQPEVEQGNETPVEKSNMVSTAPAAVSDQVSNAQVAVNDRSAVVSIRAEGGNENCEKNCDNRSLDIPQVDAPGLVSVKHSDEVDGTS
ncbi:uncharacterized protein LOC115739540 isoform X3 [Rhodamnia argentea]|uniref:Uncharacterized protein LOC115739540 isoform X3 n=1 Tax=Rhodamnia argentea TaxID=178133 RepID=A0ABM3GZR7_9MYRT|nr:uncharacterized protein LOC115739540 isoform X3 [Rhodamnia argentea]